MSESSKIARKRARKQQLGVLVASAQNERENEGVRISDRGSNSPTNVEQIERHEDQDESNINKANKKTRGKAKMINIAKGKGSPLSVEFNLKGQPIGPNAAKLSSCLGITAREIVPVTLKTFKDMPDTLVKQIWQHLKQKFDVDECHKEYLFGKMGKIWGDYRCDLVCEVKKQVISVGLNRALALLKPDNVYSMDEWKSFVKERSTPEYEAKCEKFKKMRASQTLPHRTSRKGYARLEEEMRRKSDKPDDITRTDVWIEGHEPKNGIYENEVAKESMEKVKKLRQEAPDEQHSIIDDAISIVIGPERRGRIRGLGFGATKSKVQYTSYNRDKVNNLENKITEMNDRLNQMAEILLNTQKGNVTSAHSSHNDQVPKQPQVEPTNECDNNPSGVEGRKCDILDWASGNVVGKGEIANTDPKSPVHGVPLGKGCWKVWVHDVSDNNVHCFRPTREFFYLYEALSSNIAWPIEFIRVSET